MTTSEMLVRERERKREKRERRSTRLLRPKKLYGPDSKFGVGRTKFWKDIVFHDGDNPFIPGTEIPRLKLVRIGARAVAAFEDETDEIVEALRQHRDGDSHA